MPLSNPFTPAFGGKPQRELRPQGLGVSVGGSATAVSSEYVPSDLPQVLVDKLRRLPYCPRYFDDVDAIGDASSEWRY